MIEKSRSGELTAKIGSHHLHSSYSPLKESEKIIKAMNVDQYSTFILLEPCLNYIGLLIRKLKPVSRIISIYLNKDFFERDNELSDSKYLFNPDIPGINDFIRKNISELDLEGLKIIEWEPSASFFSREFIFLKNTVAQHIRELHGNITTTSGFGKKLFKNFFKNFISINNTAIPQKTSLPIFIAGSGPGLKNDIDFLSNNRERLILIALPSSLYYLHHNGMIPDLIVSTDPGYYAGIHLSGFNNIPLIAPYTASLTSSVYNNLIIPLKQNFFPEKYFFDKSFSYMELPPNGTVAGSAVFFSHLLTTSKIFLSGLDFSFIDILSHVRPHTFDSLIEQKANRLHPSDSLYFRRNIVHSERLKTGRRTSKALRTYSGWFGANSSYLSSRCFFLNYYTNPPGTFKNINHNEAEKMLSAKGNVSFDIATKISEEFRLEKIRNYLKSSLTECNRLIACCRKTDFADELFVILNNELIFNLYLPELLQFKRHNLHQSGKDVQDKAVSLIEKSKNFLDGFLTYV